VFSENISNKIKFEKEEALLESDEALDRKSSKKLWASRETIAKVRSVLSTIPKEVQSGTRKGFRRASEIFERRKCEAGSKQTKDENVD
jgi:hypothetical protein